jgi:hypothetical protein
MLTRKLNPKSTDFIQETFNIFATKTYRKYADISVCVDAKLRNTYLVIFYCVLSILIAIFDYSTPNEISLRSLYVVPVLLSALTNNHCGALFVCLYVAVLRIVSIKIAYDLTYSSVAILLNMLIYLSANLITMEIIFFIKTTILKVLDANEILFDLFIEKQSREGNGKEANTA